MAKRQTLKWRYIRQTKYIPGHWECLSAPYSIWRYYQSLFTLRAEKGAALPAETGKQNHRTLRRAKWAAEFLENNS
jgi:hypothetical protein